MKSKAELESKFSNIYIMLLYSVMTKDMNRVKHFLSDVVYNKYLDIVNTLESHNETQMYDELNVSKIEIINRTTSNNNEIYKVRIISKYMDYIVDEQGNYKRGNNKKRIEKENILTFSKLLTSGNKNYYTCSNCGANLNINANGCCSYCGSIVDISNDDFQLIDIEVCE